MKDAEKNRTSRKGNACVIFPGGGGQHQECSENESPKRKEESARSRVVREVGEMIDQAGRVRSVAKGRRGPRDAFPSCTRDGAPKKAEGESASSQRPAGAAPTTESAFEDKVLLLVGKAQKARRAARNESGLAVAMQKRRADGMARRAKAIAKRGAELGIQSCSEALRKMKEGRFEDLYE